MRNAKNWLLALLILLTATMLPMNVKAAPQQAAPTGYQPLVLEHVEPTEEERQEIATKTYRNRSYAANKWDVYSGSYFYNQLNYRQKMLYNNVYNVCMDYLVNNTDASYSGYSGYTRYIEAPAGITVEEVETTVTLILTNCPQFYFLDSGARYSGSPEAVNAVCIEMYPDFVWGEVRRQATGIIESRLNEWTARINQKSNMLDKEIEANNIICENTEYVFSTYHQSCAGVFLEGKAVCAGYAEAFQMLCQGVGIETLTVTSDEHEWNLVKLYENWYQVDPTWNDTGGSARYLNLSDRTMRERDSNWAHVREAFWDAFYVPECLHDTVVRTVYNGVDYGAVYDEEYYLSKYPDIKQAFAGREDQALAHFVNYGMNEGRQGCKDFDVSSYKRQYVDLRNAYGNDLRSYYLHYINYGKREGRNGTGCRSLQGAVTRLNGVDYSAVYEFNYYTSAHPDIKRIFGNDDIGALAHFVNYGMKEGRQASRSFNVNSYLYRYPDLRRAFGSSLQPYYMHYLNYGQRERRLGTGCSSMQGIQTVYNGVDYSPVYDYNYYSGTYADIKKTFGVDDYKTLQHFVNYGMSEGRQGKADFEVRSYYNRYVDLRQAFGSNWKAYYIHYVSYGKREGRTAVGCPTLQNPTTTYGGVNYGPVYDYYFYIRNNPDVANAFGGDETKTLEHFVNYGMSEGRQGGEGFCVQNYANRYGDLQQVFGGNLKAYYIHYLNYGIREGRDGR